MVSSARSGSYLSDLHVFLILKIFFHPYIQFLGEKMEKKISFFCSFFKLIPRLSDSINSYDSIGKITSKSIRIHPVFFKSKFNEKYTLLVKK